MKDVSTWEIVALHAAVFRISHAQATDRIHDREGLEAAVVRPANYRYYRGGDLALQAAALAHGIAERQVFIDGNKRTAVLALRYFLEENGFVLSASEDQLFDWMVSLAHGWAADDLGDAVRGTLVPLVATPLNPPARPLKRSRRRSREVSERVPRGPAM